MAAVTVTAGILVLLVLARGGPGSLRRWPRRASGRTTRAESGPRRRQLTRAGLGIAILMVALLGPSLLRLLD